MKEATIQMDRAGRIVLPKKLRDRFRLRSGDTLAVEVRGDAIELRPTQATGKLRRLNGVLVFSSGSPLDPSTDFASESREERIDELTREVKAGR